MPMIDLEKLAIDLEQLAHKLTPIDTGNLRKAITTRAISDTTIQTVLDASRADYGIYLDSGIAPYVIKVKNAKVLTNGRYFFGKEVNHPGIQRYKGFFSNNIFSAQVDLVNRTISGDYTPLGETIKSGALGNNPSQDNAYLESLSRFKGE